MITRFVISLCLLILLLSLPNGERPAPRKIVPPNADFFFSNYADPYDVMDAVKAYAITLCVNSKANGSAAQDWMQAGADCYDSWASDTDDSSADDGGWREYQHAAYLEISALCKGQYAGQPLCEFIK